MSQENTGYTLLHADTGEAIYLWLPPYLICRPQREPEARALFEAHLAQWEKAKARGFYNSNQRNPGQGSVRGP